MKVRATLKLRNDALISARERLGLSQKDAAVKCGVPMQTYMGAEKFNIRQSKGDRPPLSTETALLHAERIAKAMGVDTSDLVSQEFLDRPPRVEYSAVAEMPPRAILEAGCRFEERNTLPANTLSDEESPKEFLARALRSRSRKVQMALAMIFGLDGNAEHTYDEAAKKMGCSRERVRQLVNRGIREIRKRKSHEDAMRV